MNHSLVVHKIHELYPSQLSHCFQLFFKTPLVHTLYIHYLYVYTKYLATVLSYNCTQYYTQLLYCCTRCGTQVLLWNTSLAVPVLCITNCCTCNQYNPIVVPVFSIALLAVLCVALLLGDTLALLSKRK